MKKSIALVLMVLYLITLLPGCTGSHKQSENNSAKTDNQPWISYQNDLEGYRIEYPHDFQLDKSQEGTRSRLVSPDKFAIIDIFAQPLNQASADDYLQYSNQHILKQEQGIKLREESHAAVNKIKAYQLSWERPLLNNRSHDLNLYREVNLVFRNMVYTFIMKTDQTHLSQYNPVLDHLTQSFQRSRLVDQSADTVSVTPWDIKLQGPNTKLQIPWNQMLFGIFNPLLSPYKFTPSEKEQFLSYEKSLGYRFDFIMTYTDFYQGFPSRLVADTYADHRIMMLTWAPFMETGTGSVIIPNIVNGEYDKYLGEWARQIKAIEEPVFVRFANEMNGDWDPWCAWFYSKDTDLYVEAWQRVYNIFQQEGANNAVFVWNPHDRSFPNFKWNAPQLYYPGAGYVDWVGLTGYNNGTGYAGEEWRGFNAIYGSIYNEYLRNYPGKPFLITEFSCSETGGDKPAWIKECMSSLKNYPNIRIAVWYDSTDGKRLYRIDSTPESRESFREGLRNPYFLRSGIKVTGR